MATDDQQVLVTGVASAPAHFTIPGNGQIQPKAIFATYDGSGAAAAFQPALKIISDGGATVGIYPTPISVGAGGSADVSWFPQLSGGGSPIPGQILQVWDGTFAAADFSFNSNVLVKSNYPRLTTFTKRSSTSLIWMVTNMDFTPGGAPNVISTAVYIDSVKQENWFAHQSVNNTIMTIYGTKVQQLDPTTGVPFAAGAHTVEIWVQSVSGANCTLLSSFACDMQIVEFEAPLVS